MSAYNRPLRFSVLYCAALVAIVAFTGACAESRVAIEHRIDHAVWTLPVPDPIAYVFPNYHIGDKILGHALSDSVLNDFRTHKDKVAFGRLGTLGVVVIGPKAAETELEGREARAAAAHETFHLLVQYFGLRPRFDMLQQPSAIGPKSAHVADLFFSKLYRKLSDGESVCPVLGEIAAFDSGIKQFIFYKSYVEWPAEWYMRWSALHDVTFNEYFAMRTRWGGGEANMLYVAGVKAFDQIDDRLGRGEWQARYVAGAHPLNLLAAAYGCAMPVGPSFQVREWRLQGIFSSK